MQAGLKSIVFDAGYTLLYPDFLSVFSAIPGMKIPTQPELKRAEIAARRLTDAADPASTPPGTIFWPSFFDALYGHAGDPAQKHKLTTLIQQSIFWTRIVSGTEAILSRLGEFYSLAVVSNSDGTLAKALQERGLARFFECVIDSRHHGMEKPEPGIFLKALDILGCPASESLYVGDIYSIDYCGARNTGMHAVLLDEAGVYAGSTLPRINSLAELEGWIKRQHF